MKCKGCRSHVLLGGLDGLLQVLQRVLHPGGDVIQRQVLLRQLRHQIQQLLGVREVQLRVFLQREASKKR